MILVILNKNTGNQLLILSTVLIKTKIDIEKLKPLFAHCTNRYDQNSNIRS